VSRIIKNRGISNLLGKRYVISYLVSKLLRIAAPLSEFLSHI